MKLWGVVAEVNEKDLVISLPGGLRGLVRAVDALDSVLSNEVEVCIHKTCLFGVIVFASVISFIMVIFSFFS